MATDYKSLIISFKEKSDKLISRNEKLKMDNQLLQDELNKQKEDLMAAHRDILEWKSKYGNLQMAKTLKDIPFAEERLSNLVRKINDCIARVNQQQ